MKYVVKFLGRILMFILGVIMVILGNIITLIWELKLCEDLNNAMKRETRLLINEIKENPMFKWMLKES